MECRGRVGRVIFPKDFEQSHGSQRRCTHSSTDCQVSRLRRSSVPDEQVCMKTPDMRPCRLFEQADDSGTARAAGTTSLLFTQYLRDEHNAED